MNISFKLPLTIGQSYPIKATALERYQLAKGAADANTIELLRGNNQLTEIPNATVSGIVYEAVGQLGNRRADGLKTYVFIRTPNDPGMIRRELDDKLFKKAASHKFETNALFTPGQHINWGGVSGVVLKTIVEITPQDSRGTKVATKVAYMMLVEKEHVQRLTTVDEAKLLGLKPRVEAPATQELAPLPGTVDLPPPPKASEPPKARRSNSPDGRPVITEIPANERDLIIAYLKREVGELWIDRSILVRFRKEGHKTINWKHRDLHPESRGRYIHDKEVMALFQRWRSMSR